MLSQLAILAGKGTKGLQAKYRIDSPGARPSLQTGYRLDIQGLRGVAVLMVAVYHIFLGRVSGGVDVFLFISAFFLTASFLRRIEGRQATRPLAYIAKAFKRLLPPALLVILTTLVLIRIFFPEGTWLDYLKHSAASLVQALNWVLLSEAVDYYAPDHSTASPFQHFWSLSIQGQVFLLFPLIFALIALIVRWLQIRPKVAMGAVLGLLTVTSLCYSVIETSTSQTTAYFNSFTRLWEFSLGGLFALILPAMQSHLQRLSPNTSRFFSLVSGLIGITGLLSCGIVLDAAGLFPGWVALWPLASAALVIIAGATPRHPRLSVTTLLASRPAVWLGSVSYSLYLVHWPLLVTALVIQDRPFAGPKTGAVVLLAAIVLAWILTVVVDAPIRYGKWVNATSWRSVLVVVLSLGLGLAAVFGWRGWIIHQRTVAEAAAQRNNPGARIFQPSYINRIDPTAPELPGRGVKSGQWFGLPVECDGKFSVDEDWLTTYCRLSESATTNKPTVAFVGNSRMEQLAPSLNDLATSRGWRTLALLKGGCYLGQRDTPECRVFDERVMEYLLKTRPEAVVLTTTFVPKEGTEIPSDNIDDTVQELLDAGIQVIAYRDQPRVSSQPNECDTAIDKCQFPIDNMPVARPDRQLLEKWGSEVAAIDLTNTICPNRVCVPEIGNVTVFLDYWHISWTYAKTMTWVVAQQLETQGWKW